MNNDLTDVAGLKVGHWTDLENGTGCTVVLCPPEGAVAGVDVRGGAPGTRETDLLDPTCGVEWINAILLSGGSAFGLVAADGVMRWLEERGIGYPAGAAIVPIVPAAILFDGSAARGRKRPGPEAGYSACEAARTGPFAQGNAGAGTGATCGKALGMAQACKSGLGSASIAVANGVVVAALVIANPFGNICDWRTGAILAGARDPAGGFADPVAVMGGAFGQDIARAFGESNTTLAVVATNARLDKPAITRVAQMAQDGLARAIRPIHTLIDGDVVFALSYGDLQADVNLIGALAADVLADAIAAAARAAESAPGLPSANEIHLTG